MKVFFDTNVLLDLLIHSRPGHDSSKLLLQVAREGVLEGYLSTQSIIDAAYVQTQTNHSGLEGFKESIRIIASILKVVPIESQDITSANDSEMSDYEDAAQLSCAENNGCDILLTSDKRFQRYSTMPSYSPQELVKLLFRD